MTEMNAYLFDNTPLENRKHCRCYWKNRQYNWMEKINAALWVCPCGIELRHVGTKRGEPQYVWRWQE